MKNSNFEIEFNKENGSICSIKNSNDGNEMNWCSDIGNWGLPHAQNQIGYGETYSEIEYKNLELLSFEEDEYTAVSVYSNDTICVTVKRSFSEKGNLIESCTIKNLRRNCLFLKHGDLKFEIPFNDNYTSAEECMKRRCNTHIWCAGNVAYVNALRMGESDINLGLVVIKGSIKSYSVKDCKTNVRGRFLLNLDHIELEKGEEYVVEWKLFWNNGVDDFYSKALKYPNFLHITSPQFTVFDHENIRFQVKSANKFNNISIFCDGKECDFEIDNDVINVLYKPVRFGEHRFDILCDSICTYTEFFVCENIKDLIKKRINFIVDNQQYHKQGSPLDGAFLIYDNEEKYHVYDSVITDHNASRERMGMTLLIIKYLQNQTNHKFNNALNKCIKFITREVVNMETGEVYNGVCDNMVRLYNAPWISTLFTEMYYLTKDKTFLNFVFKILSVYYNRGGAKFYPNGLSLLKTVTAFKMAGMKDEENQVVAWFKGHVDNIVANGVFYPPHEVNYEQTIVTPAVTFISQMAEITKDAQYVAEAKKHIINLERFNGRQPSFHLNEIPIRFWDDFWFGKSQQFGDTFPHYWSCLTARSYIEYYNVSGDEIYKIAAEKCIRNCLCLFNQLGQGSAAYVYPFESNGQKGQFYDAWANDQDFALYFFLDYFN